MLSSASAKLVPATLLYILWLIHGTRGEGAIAGRKNAPKHMHELDHGALDNSVFADGALSWSIRPAPMLRTRAVAQPVESPCSARRLR